MPKRKNSRNLFKEKVEEGEDNIIDDSEIKETVGEGEKEVKEDIGKTDVVGEEKGETKEEKVNEVKEINEEKKEGGVSPALTSLNQQPETPDYEKMAKQILYGANTTVDKVAKLGAPPLEGPFKEITDKATQYLTEVEKMKIQARLAAQQLQELTNIFAGRGPEAPEPPTPQQQVQQVQQVQPTQQVVSQIAGPEDMVSLVENFSKMLKATDTLRKTILDRLRELGIEAKDVYIHRNDVEKMLEKCREDTLREATEDTRLNQTTELIKHSIDRVVELFAPLIREQGNKVLGFAVQGSESNVQSVQRSEQRSEVSQIQEFMKNPINSQNNNSVNNPPANANTQPANVNNPPTENNRMKGLLIVSKEENKEG